jgi:N-methylhydantoinase B/oxoprolinase/acetone carboxylase alpha subunit
MELEPGDVVTVMTPGGGGWGTARESGIGNRESSVAV